MFATTKITNKGQITVPKAVRERLGLKPGDTLIYDVAGDTVTLKRFGPFDAAYRLALAETLDEWASAEDDKAFADL